MGYSNPTGLPSTTQSLKYHIDTTYFTQESRDRGSAVHGCAAAYLLGLFVSPLPKDWQGYFDSFRRWADLMVDRVVMVEKRLADPELGYCGQPDAVVVLRGDDPDCLTLPDWKTGVPAKWWRIQTASYRRLSEVGYYTDELGKLLDRVNIKTKKGGSVQLFADGRTGKFHDYTATYNRDLNIFLSILNAYSFFEGV